MLLCLVISLGCQSQKNQTNKFVSLELSVLGKTTTENYNASGVNLRELLEVKHNVTFTGRLRCIDNICDSGKYWWRVMVNNKMLMQGAEQYIVQKGDSIALRFE